MLSFSSAYASISAKMARKSARAARSRRHADFPPPDVVAHRHGSAAVQTCPGSVVLSFTFTSTIPVAASGSHKSGRTSQATNSPCDRNVFRRPSEPPSFPEYLRRLPIWHPTWANVWPRVARGRIGIVYSHLSTPNATRANVGRHVAIPNRLGNGAIDHAYFALSP
jgi:hypothetical protein